MPASPLVAPAADRPWVGNLTIRALRHAEQEIGIEFVLRGDSPMSSWVRRVRPGDPAGIFDLGTMYRLPRHARGRPLVGDETALPAILSILDSDPNPPPTEVIVEVVNAADVRSVLMPTGLHSHCLSRDVESVRPGIRALEAVRSAESPEGPVHTWVAGESRLATGTRRHLVNDRGVPRRDVCVHGYWRLGRSTPG
ncbi:siderophore-interacting protein [Streptomyces sp. BBFR51]|uniref:siderophore-interacting protein n=1 Tax=Streptomyces sp. BBFR51 TaxID=3372856 RepID=UPI0037DCD706